MKHNVPFTLPLCSQLSGISDNRRRSPDIPVVDTPADGERSDQHQAVLLLSEFYGSGARLLNHTLRVLPDDPHLSKAASAYRREHDAFSHLSVLIAKYYHPVYSGTNTG
jgi:hypothetical protein